MKIKKISNNAGISLIEIVVAITIITVGMIGVISLVVQNARAQYINKNVLIASGLAGEGLELVRNARDLNWLTPGNNWKTGAASGSGSDIVQDGDYRIDYNRDIIDVDDINAARLYINGAGFYTHTADGNTETNFYRLIEVVDNVDYLDIKCTISWIDGSQKHYYEAETYLYDWR